MDDSEVWDLLACLENQLFRRGKARDDKQHRGKEGLVFQSKDHQTLEWENCFHEIFPKEKEIQAGWKK